MSDQPTNDSRRGFLKTSAKTGAAAALLGNFAATPGVYAQGDDVIRVGLVGCGGRGGGAAAQALKADPKAVLVAMGDAFPEALERKLESLKKDPAIVDRVQVDEDHRFSGLDAFRYVIDSCDVVILATPPGFRPEQLEYAVEKGKHIFTEKPMATDAPGARRAMAAVKRAQEKGLAMVAGFCWRYDSAKRAIFEKILAGEIGDVLCSYGTYLTGPVKPMPAPEARPEGMSDLEWMVRNWYNFTWLSGDGLVEQACHTVDWIAWSKGDKPPVSCTAVGGRQIPSPGGNIYDHIEVNYLWEDGTRAFIAQRQINGCHNENNFYVLGSKGKGQIDRKNVKISNDAGNWRYKGPKPNMYQVEHDEMFASIREGKPIDNGERMMTSTLMAIMGRMAAYTGKEVTWEMAMNSQEQLVPEVGNWDEPVEFRSRALPGATPFK